jgi:AmmeMemoRadiSam system protein A
MTMPELGTTLLTLARNAIAARFGSSPANAAVDLPELHSPGATFVTLTQRQLRGCIGSLEAWRPLLADVQENARNAAFRDPRFEPLSATNCRHPRRSLAADPAEPMSFTSEADALAQLRPEIDGVIFTAGLAAAPPFLPQVWEQLPEPPPSWPTSSKRPGCRPATGGRNVRLERYTVKNGRRPAMTRRIPTPARWWHALPDGRVQCDLCPRDCQLHEGQRGACFVRQMVNGAMQLTTYGRSSGFCIDPIEKKPLNHFYPGSSILSFGTAGCNLACKFCQNWDISKSKDMDRLMDAASPQAIALAAKRYGADASPTPTTTRSSSPNTPSTPRSPAANRASATSP